MDVPTQIPVSILRQASELLLQHLEELEGPEIQLDKDYFWSIPAERLYDVYNEPSDLTIGQLTECLSHLEKMVAEPEEAISYGLVWLADLLRAVGQSVVK